MEHLTLIASIESADHFPMFPAAVNTDQFRMLPAE